MKSIEKHLEDLLKGLDAELKRVEFGTLISPDTPDTIGALEKECEKAKAMATRIRTASSKFIDIFETGLAAVSQLRYLNEAVAGEHLGEKLLSASLAELRKGHLNHADLACVAAYAIKRVQAHAPGGKYDTTHLEPDKQLPELPARIAALTENKLGIARYFLPYINEVAPEASWDQLPDLYNEFQEIMIKTLRPSRKYISLLEVRKLAKDWNEVRGLGLSPEDLKWVQEFEKLELKYPQRDLLKLAKLYEEEKKDSNL